MTKLNKAPPVSDALLPCPFCRQFYQPCFECGTPAVAETMRRVLRLIEVLPELKRGKHFTVQECIELETDLKQLLAMVNASPPEGLLKQIRDTCNYGVNSPDEALSHIDALVAAALASNGDERLREIHTFLLGQGPLEGRWFGDKTPLGGARYWWRKHLRAALASPNRDERLLDRMAAAAKECAREHLDDVEIDWREIVRAALASTSSQPGAEG